ncbi:MAG: hypothetical protein QN141_03975 [Armatimonadota bacterium]|nr:hypothetical protein [Armatimonadota bacterium]MDR7450520.1 hypothetical protein [Armatimonadota bacterium]MDR7466347.1 hypothetical protein [Armatimonadota bacterium]MDR7493068.1 hypothetical protein [Armatimonadota bacterium]MDR7498175.1 hypothetical protein [Armatimonadota bacterium]
MTPAWAIILLGALAVSVWGLWGHLRRTLARPWRPELSRAAGSPGRGVIYAFTWGMAPWAKESTRLHLLAYLRGVVFHVGIAAGLAGLALIPWRAAVPAAGEGAIAVAAAAGAVAGWGGLLVRVTEHNLRAVSTPDDLFSVALVSAFLSAGAGAWWGPRWTAPYLALGALTLVAIPLTKIRHCFYFFFSRYFFGLFYGRRGVVGGVQHE